MTVSQSHTLQSVLPDISTTHLALHIAIAILLVKSVSQRKTYTIWFHLHVESKEQYEQTKYKKTHRYRKQTVGSQREGWLGDWVKKMKTLSIGWLLQNSQGGVEYSYLAVYNILFLNFVAAIFVLMVSLRILMHWLFLPSPSFSHQCY